MSRGKNRIAGQFAPRTIEMLRSAAFRSLTVSSHRLLARLEIELADHGGKNNGKLIVTYADFIRYGMERHAVVAAIKQCVALGFVEVVEKGRGGNAEHRTPSQYRLTYRHTDRAGPTDEWRAFQKTKDRCGFSSTFGGENHTEN